ncbi:hypothetical protein TanjilG_30308 [Lupinus angustifolius]|nr:hypothetical protein TanjilG_30308 [Lupinus angustifolius]
MERILVFIGQDPLIAHESGKFIIWLIPALFAYAIMQPLVRYFQMQSLLFPMLISSCVALCIHIPLCWALVYKTRLHNVGGALALGISNWSNVIFLGLYMRYSSTCEKTRAPISTELFHGIWEFFRFAVPSALMICLEWWSFELLVLLSGLLPNPQLETSVLSVCLNTISTLYTIPFGIGAAASTRVSNELGAGNPQTARIAVLAAMSLAVLETCVVSATLFGCRHIFGYVFSNEKEVIDYVTLMAPLVCISVILDSIQGVLTGIARGCGWQHLGVYVNLGAFYLFGIPAAATLAFWFKLRGKGLWIGIQVGSFVQTLLLSIITSGINWEQQANKARNRLLEDESSADNRLVSLIEKDREGEDEPCSGIITWSVFVQEVKDVCYLSAPMITVNLSEYFLQIISLMMVGHLGKLALSGTAIAISLCAVSGFSLLLLTLLGQDPLISQEAGNFAGCMIPALFAYAILQALVRFFLMQSLIRPLVISSTVSLFFHIAFCWLLVFKSGLGSIGAAFSIGASYWLNVILLGLYMFSTDSERIRTPISMEIFYGIGEFFRYAIPSAGMICLEWWSFELLTLLSGLLPNPELETSVLSICLSTISTIYTLPESIGSAASTRVSNSLGGGSPQAARVSVFAAMALAVSEALLVSSILFACRNVLGYAFSNDQDVLDYVTDMVPLLCLSVILDTLHGTLSGIARGRGWQHLGAYVNLGAYYVVGIPIAAILGFWIELRGKGLWIGIVIGAFCQTVMLSLITSGTNWEKQVSKARERVFQGRFAVEDLV